MKCFGLDPSSGAYLEIDYDSVITGVDTLINVPADPLYVAPAWIDFQVNGYAAVDYNSPDTPHDEIARSIDVLHSTGTARFFPTVITGSREEMAGSLRNLARAKGEPADRIEGFHVRARISVLMMVRAARIRVQCVRPPDIDEYRRWQDATDGAIRLVTLSPEWPKAPAYIETLVSEGVVVSIGHTKATAEQIEDAVSAGATMSTHIGNGAHGEMRRHPNYIWDQLAEDRLAAGFIVDGIHIGRGVPESRAAGERCCAIGAGYGCLDAGDGDAWDLPFGRPGSRTDEDGRWCSPGQTRLAGSALRMDHAISNVDADDGHFAGGGDLDGDPESRARRTDRRAGSGGSRRANGRIWCCSVTMRKPGD